MKKSVVRFSLFPVVLILVVVLPWWLSAMILVILTIYFSFYLEVLFFGFLFDAIYASSYSFPYTGLTVATVFLLVVLFVKARIRT